MFGPIKILKVVSIKILKVVSIKILKVVSIKMVLKEEPDNV